MQQLEFNYKYRCDICNEISDVRKHNLCLNVQVSDCHDFFGSCSRDEVFNVKTIIVNICKICKYNKELIIQKLNIK